jgi:hypothetical protein
MKRGWATTDPRPLLAQLHVRPLLSALDRETDCQLHTHHNNIDMFSNVGQRQKSRSETNKNNTNIHKHTHKTYA